MTIGSDMLGVLLLIVVMLAAVAGAGWGAAMTYERLRPERISKEMQADALRTIEQMRAVHDEAIAELLARRVPKPDQADKEVWLRSEDGKRAVGNNDRRRHEGSAWFDPLHLKMLTQIFAAKGGADNATPRLHQQRGTERRPPTQEA